MPIGCNQRFFIDPSNGQLRINCTCGWAWAGDRGDYMAIDKAIIDHRPPMTKEPPLKVEGFVSGLPDAEPGR